MSKNYKNLVEKLIYFELGFEILTTGFRYSVFDFLIPKPVWVSVFFVFNTVKRPIYFTVQNEISPKKKKTKVLFWAYKIKKVKNDWKKK